MSIPKPLIGKATVSLWPVAGELLGLSKNSAYQAANRGEIPTLRIGARWLVPVAPLMKMLGIEEAPQPVTTPNREAA